MEDLFQQIWPSMCNNAHCREQVAIAKSTLSDIISRNTFSKDSIFGICCLISATNKLMSANVGIVALEATFGFVDLELSVIKNVSSRSTELADLLITLDSEKAFILLSINFVYFIHLNVATTITLLLLHSTSLLIRLTSLLSFFVSFE